MSDPVRPHRRQPTRLPRPWDSLGKNTGVGCHFLLQSMKVKSESEVAQSCPTLRNLMDYSLPGSSVHGIFQARVLEWGAIAFSIFYYRSYLIKHMHYHSEDNHLLRISISLSGKWEISDILLFILSDSTMCSLNICIHDTLCFSLINIWGFRKSLYKCVKNMTCIK